MDVKEKLVELLNEVQETGVNEIPAGFGCTRQYITNERVAAHLISHGVTVQEKMDNNTESKVVEIDHVNETPQTNADRVRSMADEELATFLCEGKICTFCFCDDFCEIYGGKGNGLLKWLQKPAEKSKEEKDK